MARKQDWSTRGAVYMRCDVTLEYQYLPKESPVAQDLLRELEADADPETHVIDGLSRPQARKEARKFKRLIEDYRRGKWWYVKVFAYAVVPVRDYPRDVPTYVATEGDVIESNWPAKHVGNIEGPELHALWLALLDKGVDCRRFRVLRLGARGAMQDPKWPGEETWTVMRDEDAPEGHWMRQG